MKTEPSVPNPAVPALSRWVRWRLLLCSGLLCSLFFLVSARAYVLQVREAEQYRVMAEEQYLREIELPAHRGRILDRIGTELAASTEVDSAYGNPRLLRGEQDSVGGDVVRALAGALRMDPKEVQRRLRSNHFFTWIKRRILPEEARALRTLNIAGVGLLKEPKRYYPNRDLFGPVLGWVGMDGSGLEGIELYYDRWLKGQKAALPGLRDARGQQLLLTGPTDAAESHGGHDVYLTLDKFIQFRLEQALAEGVQSSHAKAGVALAMDPHSGEILAMASVPSLNPNDPSSARERGVRNRPVTDPFEPGSTMKPFSIGAAIESGAVNLGQEWDCENGKWKIGKATIHDAHPEGTLTTTQVLARSSNICTAKITRRMGKERLEQFLRKLGFARPTGVDLPGERAGQLRPLERWGEVGFATISFGQGMTATPLQIATGLSVYANGGILYRPHVVRRIVDARGRTVLDVKPEGHRVISEQTARTMREMMRAVMQKHGTGEKLDIPGYPVAGKTGTAQKVDPATRHYSPRYWASSFVGFAPHENPRLLVFVMVDEPQGSHYGGEVAGPIFVKAMSAALPYLGVAPEALASAGAAEPAPRESPAAPASPKAARDDNEDEDEETEEQGTAPGDPASVPSFLGLGMGNALALAQKTQLRLEVSGSGYIVSQFPRPGTRRRGPVCKVRLAPPE